MAKTSNIELYSNIQLDRDYRNVCDNVSRETLSSYKQYSQQNMSFIKFDLVSGEVEITANYATATECNYMSFQNVNYSARTWYAWIDNVTYISDNCTRISFTIDMWTTYYHDWTANECFVLREHPSNDTIGANTLWEDVPIIDNWVEVNQAYEDFSTYNYKAWFTKEKVTTDDMEVVDNVLSAVPSTGVIPVGAMREFIQQYVNEGHQDRIVDIQAVPSNSVNAISLSMTSTLDGYTPKWNKLYTAQFNKFILTDMQGNTKELYREYSDSNGIGIIIRKSINNTVNVQAIPANYNGFEVDYSNSITITGFPKVAWQGNSYAQWVAQNGATNLLGQVASSVAFLNGLITKNPTSIIGGAIGMLGSYNQRTVAQQVGSQAYGSVNSGSLLAAYNALGIYIIQVCQPAEYLQKADNFFTRYGYRTDTLKTPNLSGNYHQNYIQVADELVNGTLPSSAAETLNNAARRGMTIWHSLDYIGDY